MPTISSMLRGTYQMYKKYGINGFNTKLNSSSKSASNSINSFWSSYNPTKSTSAASSTLSGLLGIRSNISEMVNTYNSTKKTFDTELTDTLSDLKKSTTAVKNLDFNVGKDALTITENVNEDGTISTTSTMNENLTEVVNGIKEFVGNYNDAIKFFDDNSNVSKYVKNMAKIFGDTTYNSGSASNIGLKVDSTGKMTIDEDILAKTITENPTRVKSVMSTLTNKSDRHISFAKSQQSRMFPSMQNMLGGSFKSASVYSGNSLMRISNYSSVGNLLNYFA